MQSHYQSKETAEPLAYRVNEFCHRIGICRSSLYGLIKEGKLRTVVIAGRRLVPACEVARLLADRGAQ